MLMGDFSLFSSPGDQERKVTTKLDVITCRQKNKTKQNPVLQHRDSCVLSRWLDGLLLATAGFSPGAGRTTGKGSSSTFTQCNIYQVCTGSDGT